MGIPAEGVGGGGGAGGGGLGVKRGSGGGVVVVVRALAFHKCGSGSIPGPGFVCCWFSPCSERFFSV